MFKKTFAAAAVAAALLFTSAAAANADDYTSDNPVRATDPSLVVGESTTVTAFVAPDVTSATFSSTAGASLSSVVAAAAAPSVTKTPAGGVATATFEASAPGTYVVSVSAATPDGAGVIGSTTIVVTAAAAAGGGSSLPSTGGEFNAAALWVGAGALGLGALAVVGATARRRAAQR